MCVSQGHWSRSPLPSPPPLTFASRPSPADIAIPDLADAIVRASEATSVAPGRHEVVYIAAADNIGGRDLAKAVAEAYGGRVPMKATPLPRIDASGLDCSKAAALLGWTPQLSWRDYLDERGGLLPGVRALQLVPGGVHSSAQIKAASATC